MFTREDLIKKISDMFVEIVAKAKSRVDLNYYDSTRSVEMFVLKVLNIVYNLELVDLNKESKNYPAVDLGNKKTKIAYQVSINIDNVKLNETISTLNKNAKVTNEFDKFRFFDFRISRGPIKIPKNAYGITKDSLFYFKDVLKDLQDMDVDITIVNELFTFVNSELEKGIDYLESDDEQNIIDIQEGVVPLLPKHHGYLDHIQENLTGVILADTINEFNQFKNKLEKLSTQTKVLLYSIIDDSVKDRITGDYVCNFGQIFNKFDKKYDLDSESTFLISKSFLNMEELDDSNSLNNYYCLTDNNIIEIKYFCEKNQISSKKYILDLDFYN